MRNDPPVSTFCPFGDLSQLRAIRQFRRRPPLLAAPPEEAESLASNSSSSSCDEIADSEDTSSLSSASHSSSPPLENSSDSSALSPIALAFSSSLDSSSTSGVYLRVFALPRTCTSFPLPPFLATTRTLPPRLPAGGLLRSLLTLSTSSSFSVLVRFEAGLSWFAGRDRESDGLLTPCSSSLSMSFKRRRVLFRAPSLVSTGRAALA
mmetsp:Transcript_38850/g.60582  ORF Transcript_38850/g.60582 Transcript_38850/m.60582 type:complete len:207 (-) Transcript_38850:304-924(-)